MTTQRHQVALEATPDPVDVRTVRAGLRAHNHQFAPVDNYQPVTVFLRDEDGRVLGGLLGATYWGWLHVDTFWLADSARHQGYGRRLLHAAEQEAVRRGCHHAHLDTMSFQSVAFYIREGYTIFGALDNLPQGHSRIFLQKALRPEE